MGGGLRAHVSMGGHTLMTSSSLAQTSAELLAADVAEEGDDVEVRAREDSMARATEGRATLPASVASATALNRRRYHLPERQRPGRCHMLKGRWKCLKGVETGQSAVLQFATGTLPWYTSGYQGKRHARSLHLPRSGLPSRRRVSALEAPSKTTTSASAAAPGLEKAPLFRPSHCPPCCCCWWWCCFQGRAGCAAGAPEEPPQAWRGAR